jgi:hypothetical protein
MNLITVGFLGPGTLITFDPADDQVLDKTPTAAGPGNPGVASPARLIRKLVLGNSETQMRSTLTWSAETRIQASKRPQGDDSHELKRNRMPSTSALHSTVGRFIAAALTVSALIMFLQRHKQIRASPESTSGPDGLIWMPNYGANSGRRLRPGHPRPGQNHPKCGRSPAGDQNAPRPVEDVRRKLRTRNMAGLGHRHRHRVGDQANPHPRTGLRSVRALQRRPLPLRPDRAVRGTGDRHAITRDRPHPAHRTAAGACTHRNLTGRKGRLRVLRTRNRDTPYDAVTGAVLSPPIFLGGLRSRVGSDQRRRQHPVRRQLLLRPDHHRRTELASDAGSSTTHRCRTAVSHAEP